MEEAVHLFFDSLLDCSILVAESVHGDASDKVKILLAVLVEQVRTFATDKFNIGLAIKRGDKLLVFFKNGISQGLCHSSVLH